MADASHELRTPITSLRTNIEVLLEQGDQLTGEDRRRLLADVLEQSEELSALIGDVIELARGDLPITSAEDVRLDRVVDESLIRARRDFPHVRFETSLEPVIVEGVPERLARAVNNLLDNAAHHSPADGVVEVIVNRDGVQVRDHGTGIDEADLPYVFDRFYRGANSRHRQGSGLGLAIVRQVATQHGGSIEAANAPDGGAVFTLRLPTVAPTSWIRTLRPGRWPATRCPPGSSRSANGSALQWARQPRLARHQEPPAQKPGAHGEHRRDRHEQQQPHGRRPDGQDDQRLGQHGGHRSEQHGVRAIAREVLARGHLDHPEQAQDTPPISAGPPCRMTPTTSATAPARIAISDTGRPPNGLGGRSP